MADNNVTQPPLAQRLGGASGLDALLGAFYFRVLAEPDLAKFFRATPMDRLLAHQREFLGTALVQPTAELRERLTRAHGSLVEELGLAAVHFDGMLAALRGAMSDLGYDEETIQELVACLDTFRPDVLGASSAGNATAHSTSLPPKATRPRPEGSSTK